MKTKFLFLSAILVLSACASNSKKSSHVPENTDAAHLRTVIDTFTDRVKHLDAYDAAYFNIEENLSRFGDFATPAYYERSRQILKDSLDALKTINFENLPADEKIEYRIFKDDMEVSLAGFDYPGRYLQFTQMYNRLRDYADSSSEALTIFPFDTVAHYEAYLKRSEGFSAYIDAQIALLREGIKKKITLNCTVAPKVRNSYKDALETDTEKNPFFRPATFMPKSFSDADRTRLTAEFKTMVAERIIPGYIKFDKFFKDEYIPQCRSNFGLKGLPNADAWYRHEIRASTNLDLAPKSVHQTGLNEVTRIAGELEKIKKASGFKGSLHEYLKKRSEDPASFFTSAETMFKAFQDTKTAIQAKLPAYFSLMPKADFKIVETSNPEDAAGSYNGPTESAPYGRFIVNTKNLRSVPLFDVTTLMLHETIPGHHFQIALQYEMKETLSEYRRKIFFSNSFAEGWALYSEYLGNEMGLFQDGDQKFGNLNDEMLRAVRLVVDTGIHSMGWSQKKAIAYASRYLASDAKDIETEINRYSVWPGQALGYKIGQLKILELRKKAEAALGAKFDIKGFHRVVIGNGTVPLGVLESNVNEWIEQQKQATAFINRKCGPEIIMGQAKLTNDCQ